MPPLATPPFPRNRKFTSRTEYMINFGEVQRYMGRHKSSQNSSLSLYPEATMDKNDLKIWDPARPLEESPGPFGPEIPEESPKESPPPRSKKCPKQSRKSLRSLKTVFFETPDTLPRFGARGRKAPGDSFGDSSGIPGPKGPGDSSKGSAGSQILRFRHESILEIWGLLFWSGFLSTKPVTKEGKGAMAYIFYRWWLLWSFCSHVRNVCLLRE